MLSNAAADQNKEYNWALWSDNIIKGYFVEMNIKISWDECALSFIEELVSSMTWSESKFFSKQMIRPELKLDWIRHNECLDK